MNHTDHDGNILVGDQINIYWRGFIKGKDSLKPNRITKFKDETGFERYLISMGWTLFDYDYPTDFFTTYGTIIRLYTKGDKEIGVGLLYKNIGIVTPYVVNNSLPLPGEYEVRLWEILNNIERISPAEMLNDI